MFETNDTIDKIKNEDNSKNGKQKRNAKKIIQKRLKKNKCGQRK